MEITQNADEQQIRELIERWAAAIRAGDLEAVLASHTDDVVMYDVPPPFEDVRGIEAYHATWPEFFAWLASGAMFEITSLEITAGDDVAFAHGLLRCGTPEDLAAHPENRLRLTWGLVKDRGRWAIRHEHHSFPLTDGTTATSAED
ncbi:MAG TPA: SgcJ/EcaC family oxidoreductase, partial [Actinopolymorphaceae bacterium]